VVGLLLDAGAIGKKAAVSTLFVTPLQAPNYHSLKDQPAQLFGKYVEEPGEKAQRVQRPTRSQP
jgi:hypothetical protein